MTKGIIYYTDNTPDERIFTSVQKRLQSIAQEKRMSIISSSLKKLSFGDKNIHFPSLKRGHLTMFTQILAALEHSPADIVFFCEHDVLYHPSHFDFTPARSDAYYYNTNVWKVWLADGVAIWVDNCTQTSGLCGYRDLLLGHYQRRITKIKQNAIDLTARGMEVKLDGFSRHMGFEPGLHMNPRGVDKFPALTWKSTLPNVDIRHSKNFTAGRRNPSEFFTAGQAAGWTESTIVPGWGSVLDIISQLC